MSETQTTLPFSIEITMDGKPREIFMSFALLNRICYLMGDGTNIPLILQDPELREAVLTECYAERDHKGKISNRPGIDEVDVSFVDIQRLLEFASEHVADFTVAAVEKATQVMLRKKARIDAIQNQSSLTPTPVGSENSVSKSVAA